MHSERPGVALSRRAFVRFAGGGLLVSGVALLEACAPAATPAPATAPVATVPPAATGAPTVAAKPTAAAATAGLAKPQAGLVPGQIGVSKSVALPTRVPIPGAKPDLPGSA